MIYATTTATRRRHRISSSGNGPVPFLFAVAAVLFLHGNLSFGTAAFGQPRRSPRLTTRTTRQSPTASRAALLMETSAPSSTEQPPAAILRADQTKPSSTSPDEQQERQPLSGDSAPKDESTSNSWWFFPNNSNRRPGPPILVEDPNVLLYDVTLLLNLSASISFWVVHRMDLSYISASLSEGSLFCVCWIIAGLYHGAFLYSAVDGHQNPYSSGYDNSEQQQQQQQDSFWRSVLPKSLFQKVGGGGPLSAAWLGMHTMISASTIRCSIALLVAILQHRPALVGNGEDLITMEIGFGLLLMSAWRSLHSSYNSGFRF